MRENYMKQVNRNLVVSRKKKKEIIRDLQEAFVSAVEHGETEQQVIERLGSPVDFADSIHEQFGINRIAKEKRKKQCQIAIALAVAIAAFAVGIIIMTSRLSVNVIGQANAMTNIQISGTAFDPFILFIMTGVAALAAAIILMIRCFHKK